MSKALQVFANRNKSDRQTKIFSTVIDSPLMDDIDGSFFDRLDFVEQELVFGDPEEFSIMVAKTPMMDYNYVAYLSYAEALDIKSDIDFQVIVVNDSKGLMALLETFTPFVNIPFEAAWNNEYTYGEVLTIVINRVLLPLEI